MSQTSKLVGGWGAYQKGEYLAKHYKREYDIWTKMIRRVYSEGSLKNRPTYRDCVICEDWRNFQDFMLWAENAVGYGETGFELDKDLLFKGNKVYAPDKCVFIPTQINSFLSLTQGLRGKYPVGVCFHKRIKKFQAQITRGCGRESLGYYATPEEAFEAYKIAKEAYAKELAAKWRDKIDPRAYEALMNYTVEITD